MELKESLFYFIVYGPGYGESVILRDPAGTWTVIDGCLVNDRSPAADLLAGHDASWSCVIITHPHHDHALGLEAVLDRPGAGPIGCTAPRVAAPETWIGSADAERHLREGTVEHVLAAIHDSWTTHPECRWEMRRGDRRQVGELFMTVLHPDEETVAARPGNPNRLSSGLLVTWQGVKLLLGGDVVAQDWANIAESFEGLGSHHGMKLPHHGSRGAVHDSWGAGSGGRMWIVTPHNRGLKLPRFDDGHGISWALEQVGGVHLTGLPRRHDLQGRVPYVTTRQALRDGHDPSAACQALSSRLMFCPQPEAGGTADAYYVAVGFNEQGALVDVQHGPGALVIRQAAEGA